MTNAGVNGYPPGASGAVADGSISAAKLAAPLILGCYLASGQYYFAGSGQTATTSAVLGNGSLRVSPWWVPNTCVLSRIGAEVTSAGDVGSKLRLGIYSDNGSTYPGSLVLDAGTIAGDSNTVQEITINQRLTPGLYWIGGAVQVVTVTQPTVRINNPGTTALSSIPAGTTTPAAGAVGGFFFQSGVTGALPQAFTSTVTTADRGLRAFVKVA